MSTRSGGNWERTQELLADRAVGVTLSEADEHLLEVERGSAESDREFAALELAAAQVALACALEQGLGKPPEHLVARLRSEGRAWATSQANPRASDGAAEAALRPAATQSIVEGRAFVHHAGGERPVQTRGRARTGLMAAGWLAAAASLVLAAVGWWPRLTAPSGGSNADVQLAMQSLVRTSGDVQRMRWERGNDEAAAANTGEVLWSSSRQEGYMVFRGLRHNNPAQEQYQLWIFDPERDERYPVHGGVFDVPADCGELVVRIVPHLPVPRAAAFVVTVEKPGGVWVSDRKRIAAIAKAS